MPCTIHNDASSLFDNIIFQEKPKDLEKLNEIQSIANAAEHHLNSLISMKQSMDMAIQEMIDLKIDPTELLKETKDIDKQIEKATIDFNKKKVAAQQQINQ